MRNIFNFTNRDDTIRKTGTSPEVKVSVSEKNDKTFFETIINFDNNRNFPNDAEIFIQAYSNSGYVGKPISLGLISSPIQKEIEEPEVGSDEIKFRLKIVSNIKYGKIRKIIGQCLNIEAWGSDTFLKVGKREQKSLIEFEVLPGEVPILFFKKGFGLEKDLKQSNYLKNIFYNIAVNEILKTYIVEQELFNECPIKKVWVNKFESITNDKFPNVFDEEAKIWITDACAKFLNFKNDKVGNSLIDLMPTSDVETKEKILYKK